MFLSPLRFGWVRSVSRVVLLAAASLVHTVGHAQGAPGRADPLDPQARVPAVVHASALAAYRRLGDDKRVPWAEANEAVNRIGGWRAYAREAAQPEPAALEPGGQKAR